MILVAGHFKGKRIVALKQLKSGLIAVTGLFKLNGVPVKRVNSAYTMTISTVVDLKGVSVDSITDETLKTEKVPKTSFPINSYLLLRLNPQLLMLTRPLKRHSMVLY